MATRLSHSSAKKLAEEAMDVGNKLLQLPSSTAEIIKILAEVEQILFRVQQSPSRLVIKALDQIITALIAKELLIHPDVAVNISVACCICDVLTIMTPYNHEQMKEFFQLVVATFEKLASTCGGCYTEMLKVLHTLSSVKFMELMSECLQLDGLIVRLFKQFISVADSNSSAVVSKMEQIMTMIMGKSKDLYVLAGLLTTSVKKNDQIASPVSCQLVEKVLKNCAARLSKLHRPDMSIRRCQNSQSETKLGKCILSSNDPPMPSKAVKKPNGKRKRDDKKVQFVEHGDAEPLDLKGQQQELVKKICELDSDFEDDNEEDEFVFTPGEDDYENTDFTGKNSDTERHVTVVGYNKSRKKHKKKGKTYLGSEDEVVQTVLSTRSSPQTMSYAANHIFNNPSLKSYVERMGFGKILKLHIEIIPSKLAWSILSCYDVGNRCLILNGQRVEITRGLVYEILGFPMGGLEIDFVKRINYKNLEFLGLMETFWKQFTMKDAMDENDELDEKDNPKMKRSSSKKLKDFILKRKTIDDTFKLNFIILLVTTMICASKGGESNMKFLPSIKEHYDNLHMYDWCGLVLKSLDQNPPELAKNSANNKYCGPLTFLTLVYIRWLFQRTKKRNEAVIEYCSTELLKKVDEEHIKLKNFGEFFDNDELFFCEKNIRIVDEPVVDESNDVLLIENKHVREEESQDVDFESQENDAKQNQSLESSKIKEVTNPLSEESFPFEENDFTVTEVGQAPPPGDIISVQGYSVKQSIAPILESIFNKHGNIAADCFLREPAVRTYFLEVICEVARLIETNDVATIISKMEEIEFQMSEVEAANIDVSWLQAQLETTLLMEMKVNTILVKRAARTDLIERCEELVAAKERCVKAEECIKVLDLVEDKPISTVIAKRAARVDLRERCREHAVAKDQFDKAERCVKVLDLVEEKLSNNNILESKAENTHG